MSHYESWDEFCNRVFETCGKSGQFLKMLYAAGGMALIFVILSMLGFGPFAYASWILGFLVTPLGWVVVAVLGAAAVPVLRLLFSERKKLQPVLRRLTDAKPLYERIAVAHPDPASSERMQLIDSLLKWVVEGGTPPDLGSVA